MIDERESGKVCDSIDPDWIKLNPQIEKSFYLFFHRMYSRENNVRDLPVLLKCFNKFYLYFIVYFMPNMILKFMLTSYNSFAYANQVLVLMFSC